jgi:hypothetical protein
MEAELALLQLEVDEREFAHILRMAARQTALRKTARGVLPPRLVFNPRKDSLDWADFLPCQCCTGLIPAENYAEHVSKCALLV